METKREFKDVIKSRDVEAAMPVDEYLRSLDRLIAESMNGAKDELTPAIGAGTASRDVVKRLALEYYYLGKWMTPEFPFLITTAPDTDALKLDASEHYQHWAQNFADESGFLGDPNHVDIKVEFCKQVHLSEAEILAYTPLAETIGMVFTHNYYIRRSYEEGLATLGFAGERLAARSGYAKTLYEGLRDHYGLDVMNFKTHAYAEGDHGEKAEQLFRKVATSGYVQRRCREAVRNVTLVKRARILRMNEWVE
ncbi:MAG: iron-containing redox enzyme family protein [Candidatus Binatia bacterium]